MEEEVIERSDKCKRYYENIAKDWTSPYYFTYRKGTLLSSKKSPSGKFSVDVYRHKKDEHTCHQHILYLTEDGNTNPIHIIYGSDRGISEFFVRDGYEWYLTHRNYVAPLFFNLETYEEYDTYSTKDGQNSHNFIWRETDFSPDGKLVCVRGCVWAEPYETRFYDISNLMYPKWINCDEDFNYFDLEFLMDSVIHNDWISNDVCRCNMVFQWEENNIEIVIASWEFKLIDNTMKTVSTNFTPEYHIIRKNGDFILDNEFEIPKTDETCKKITKFFTDRGVKVSMLLMIPDHQSKLTESIDYDVYCGVGGTNGKDCFWSLNNPTCYCVNTTKYKSGVRTEERFTSIEDFFKYWDNQIKLLRSAQEFL